MNTTDSNGNDLNDGDTVRVIKDLKVKGSQINLKRGTQIKNIKTTEDSSEVECKIGKSQIVLRTEFLKKA